MLFRHRHVSEPISKTNYEFIVKDNPRKNSWGWDKETLGKQMKKNNRVRRG